MPVREKTLKTVEEKADTMANPSDAPGRKNLVRLRRSQFWDLYRDGLTQGLLGRFLGCPERHRLAMVEGLSKIRTGGALAFGSLFHEVLDVVARSHETAPTPGKILEIVSSIEKRDRDKLVKMAANAQQLQELEENFGLAEVVLQEYFVRWRQDFETKRWVCVEEHFSVPYQGTRRLRIPVRGKWDGLYRTGASNALWLFETKTKARIEEDNIADMLGFDLQVCLYLWAAEQVYGERPVGVLYNIVRRPQLKQNQKETRPQFLQRVGADIRQRPEFYFQRMEAVITDEDMRKWQGEFHSMVRQLESHFEGQFHFRNPMSCTGKGTCEFLPVCSRGDRFGLEKREHTFPELVAGAE